MIFTQFLGLNTSNITGGLFSVLSSLLFWFVLGVAFIVVAFGSLMIRKRRKLQFTVFEITDLGSGKMGINTKGKAGWFKHRLAFFGLYDYGGEEVLRHKDGRIIRDASSEDFQEINGKRGLLCIRSPEDPRILVPVAKLKVTNAHLLAEIAPATYRETAVSIIKQAEKETADRLEKIMQYVFIAGAIIFALIAIILVTQMVKQGQAEAKDLILEAGRITKDNIEAICKAYVPTSVPGASP